MRISVFDNQHEAIKELPEDRQGAFWVALMAYVFEGAEPTYTEPLERVTWQLIKPYLDKAKTNSKNGKKGGRKSVDNTDNKTETKANKNRNESEKKRKNKANENQALLENENEREGLGVSLKDTLTPSPRENGGAGAVKTAPPSAEELQQIFDEVDATIPDPFDIKDPDPASYEVRDMTAYLEAFNADSDEPSTPCPPEILAAVKGGAA